MKRMIMTAMITAAFAVGTLAQTKTITVESDQKLDTDFSKYKTFSFASMIDSDLEAGTYFLNDLVLKSQLREAVKEELMGLGYEMQKQNADMVVTFRVFESPVTLKGYEGYGTSYWGDTRFREVSDTTSYDVKAGTLLISFADRKSGQVVWQGFASGLISDNKFIKDERKIREAVSMLIDEEYGERAREYTRK